MPDLVENSPNVRKPSPKLIPERQSPNLSPKKCERKILKSPKLYFTPKNLNMKEKPNYAIFARKSPNCVRRSPNLMKEKSQFSEKMCPKLKFKNVKETDKKSPKLRLTPKNPQMP